MPATRSDAVKEKSVQPVKFRNPQNDLETAIQRYAQLYDFAPIAYISFNRVGRIEELNVAAAKLLGKTRTALLGKPFAVCVSNAHLPEFLQHLLLCRTNRTKIETSLDLKGAKGEKIPVQLSSTPSVSFISNGALLYQTVIVDLRERKRAEAELRAREERYRTLFDLVPVAVYSCDEKGFIQDFNQRAVELWGRQPDRNGSRERYCGSFKIFYPNGSPMPHRKCPMARVLRGEKIRPDELEIVVERPNGERRSVVVGPKALTDDDGKIIGAINCLYDITDRKRIESNLRESEEQLRRAIENAPIPVIMHAEDGQVLQISKTWTRLTGYRREDIPTFDAWLNRAYGFGAERVRDRVRRLFQESIRTTDVEFEIVTRSGERRNWSFSASVPGILSDGRRFVVGMALDVTERKKAEAELRAKKNELDLIVTQTPFMLTRCSRDLRFRYVSRAYAKLVGRKPEEIAGKRIADIMGQKGLAAIRPYIKKVLSGQQVDYRAKVPFRNGELRFLHGTYLPDKNERGEVVGWIASLFDLTESKAAEERLRQSEEELRATFNQTNAAMGLTDLEGRLTFVNDRFCQMLGYTRKELIGKTIQDRTHPDDVEENIRLFDRMIAKSIPYAMEKRYLRKDGSIIWVNVSASPICASDGKPQSGVVVALDITERKKAEAALQESKAFLEARVKERTADLLSANEELQKQIAHRQRLEAEILEISDREQRRLGQDLHDSLCQHLAAISFMARAVALRLKNHRAIDAEDIDKIAALISEGVTEARTIARGLHPVAIDSAGLMNALQSLVKQNTWGVPCRLETNGEILVSDPMVAQHLYRIAQEAIINANKYAGAREIIVRMRASNGGLELSVIDDGEGIKSVASNSEGMGLHIMKYRADAIKARLEVKARKPRGTRVSCYLPRK